MPDQIQISLTRDEWDWLIDAIHRDIQCDEESPQFPDAVIELTVLRPLLEKLGEVAAKANTTSS
jgi:hypothetical protein